MGVEKLGLLNMCLQPLNHPMCGANMGNALFSPLFMP